MSLGLVHKFYGGYTIGHSQRSNQQENNDYPGVGEYQVQQSIKQNSYTMQKQKKVSYFDIKRVEQPELGTYDIVDGGGGKSQSLQFRYKDKRDYLKERIGPGSYEIIKPITINQKYSFGFRDGQQIDHQQGMFQYNPQKQRLMEQKREQKWSRDQIFQSLIEEAKERTKKVQSNNRMSVKDKEKIIQKEEQNIKGIQQKIVINQNDSVQDQSICGRLKQMNNVNKSDDRFKKVNGTFGKSERPSPGCSS